MNLRMLMFAVMVAGACNTAGLIWTLWLIWRGYATW